MTVVRKNGNPIAIILLISFLSINNKLFKSIFKSLYFPVYSLNVKISAARLARTVDKADPKKPV